MTALSTTGNVETLPKNMYLVSNIDAAVTSCKISYVPKAMTQGVLLFDEGTTNEERVGFNGVADNGDGTATLSNLTRGMSYYLNGFAGDPTLAHPHTGNACTVRLVWPHEFANLIAYKDQSNTFTNHQLLSGNFEIRFGSSSRAIWVDSGGNLSLKDSNNATKTLSQLAANAGTDEKAKVTAADTTSDYLFNKLLAAAPITVTKNNPAANETLTFAITLPLSVSQIGTGSPAAGKYVDGATGAWTALPNPTSPVTAPGIATSDSNTISGTTVETDFNKKVTATGGTSAAGDTWEIDAYGIAHNPSGSVNPTFKVYVGSTAVVSFGAFTPFDTSDANFELHVKITIRTASASGVVQGGGYVFGRFNPATPVFDNQNKTAIDFTADQVLKITGTMGSAASNTLKLTQVIFRKNGATVAL